MLASELSAAIADLTSTHGDCPVYHAEEGSYDTSPVQSVEAIIQEPLPPGSHPASRTLVPAGTTYFLIR